MAAPGSLRGALPALLVLAMLLASGCVARNAEDLQDTPRAETEIRLIQATQDETGGARVTWVDEPTGILAKYEVIRDGEVVATVQSPARAYVDEDVQAGRAYTYQVRGYYPDGEAGPLSAETTVTLRRSLALVQDEPLGRGYVNLTVLSRSPGLRWTDLDVRLGGEEVPKSPSGVVTDGTWSHTDRQDELVDLGDVLTVRATRLVRNNATLTATLTGGDEIFSMRLEGRPTMNLTVLQERNATQGRVSLVVTDLAWTDRGREVTPADASLRPRWSELAVFVNGTRVPFDKNGEDRSWTHEVPEDDVIRVGERLIIWYSDLVGRGARIVLFDDVAQAPAFDLTAQ